MKKYICIFAIALLLGGVIYAQQNSTKKAFLGIVAVPADEVLASHLQLEKNSGFVLKLVLKDSAAEKAGLKKNDIIFKINGKELDNSLSIADAISNFKPEETVKISFLRAGKAEEVELTLGEVVPRIHTNGNADRVSIHIPESNSDESVQVQIMEEFEEMDKLRETIHQSFKKETLELDPEIKKALSDMANKNQAHLTIKGSVMSYMSSNDGEHEVTIRTKDGNKTATVKDKEGKVLFEGNINTDAEIQNIPEPIRDKIIKFQNNIKIINNF